MWIRTCLSAAAAAWMLTACGGGDYEKLVSFGDSLSDVGSYRTPGIASVGGGKFTVNGPGNLIWIEQLAERLGLPEPCAAQTGLNATGTLAAFAGPVEDHADCTAYGQGGSRVTNPIGPWNAALTASSDPTTAFQGQLGQLTVPLVSQVEKHLATHEGAFGKDDLVLVMAGGNDLFMLAGALPARIAELAPTLGLEAATTTASGEAVQGMATAGAELASLVKTRMLGKGARHVVVVNLPNVSLTPSSQAQDANAQALILAMTQAFNQQLATGLTGLRDVLQVDAFALSTDQAAHPANYGLSNVSTPACDSASPLNPLRGYSLTCSTAATLNGADVSHYAYADTVHPTPYAHSLLAERVLEDMKRVRWYREPGRR